VTRALSFLLAAMLVGCGDLPRPFQGRPGATALRLATPPPARLTVPPPAQAMLPGTDAVHMAQDLAEALVGSELPAFAQEPRAGDWQVRMSTTLSGQTVQPQYVLLDADGHQRGDVAGDPIPASAWAAGDAATLRGAAAAAAPRITALMRAIDATMKQSDPNSLYNRPARIFLAGVTGAPGDGDWSLARQIGQRLPLTGDLIVKTAADADFIVQGRVKATALAGGQEQIEIHWIVTDNAGHEAGDVAQGHDFPQGALNRYWGEVAEAVAEEAAGGVHEVITNWSGRKAAKTPGSTEKEGQGSALDPSRR
jgi:hypothetical protein